MKLSRLALYIAICCSCMNANASENHFVFQKFPSSGISNLPKEDDKTARTETNSERHRRKREEHQKRVDYYTSIYDPCSEDAAEVMYEAMFEGVYLDEIIDEIKCTKQQASTVPEPSKAVAEKKNAIPEKSTPVAKNIKANPENITPVVVKSSRAEPEKQKPQSKPVYSYVQDSNFKSPVGAKTQEEALMALNKDIDKAEQDFSKPFFKHIGGKITNRPTPTCKLGEYQKMWWCESTVTFTGQTYSDPAKEVQTTRTTIVQER